MYKSLINSETEVWVMAYDVTKIVMGIPLSLVESGGVAFQSAFASSCLSATALPIDRFWKCCICA